MANDYEQIIKHRYDEDELLKESMLVSQLFNIDMDVTDSLIIDELDALQYAIYKEVNRRFIEGTIVPKKRKRNSSLMVCD